MKEYIWVGAKTGKIAKDNREGEYIFDLSEGEYNLYKKCSSDEDHADSTCLHYVTIVSFVECDTGAIIVEAYEHYKDASRRFNELHNEKLFNVNEIFMRQVIVRG